MVGIGESGQQCEFVEVRYGLTELSPVIILLNPLNRPPPEDVCISMSSTMNIIAPASARESKSMGISTLLDISMAPEGIDVNMSILRQAE